MTPDLTNLLIDATDLLTSAEDGDQAWEAIQTISGQLGANAVNGVGLLSATKQPVWARSSMAPEWLAEYERQRLQQIDPLVIGAMSGSLPERLSTGTRLPGMAPDPREAQLHAGLARHSYNFFASHLWTEGALQKLVVLSSEQDPAHLLQDGNGRILRAISALLAAFLSPPTVARVSLLGIAYERLSSREHDVLALLAHGSGNTQISERLGIAEVTVRMHLRRARDKMGAATREQAVALAMVRDQLSL